MAVDIQAPDVVPGIVDDPRLAGRRILVAYGSETGNSQDAAETLERVAERLRFQTYLCEMNSVTFVSDFRGRLAICQCIFPSCTIWHLLCCVTIELCHFCARLSAERCTTHRQLIIYLPLI